MGKHKILTTDKEIEKALAEAASAPEEPFVSEVRLENISGVPSIFVRMSDGSTHAIPKAKLQGIAGLTNEAASRIEITEDGFGLRWPDLDIDMYVPSLLEGLYGTRAWMSSLGKLGGQVRSDAKSRAARLNGLKGGRPRKFHHDEISLHSRSDRDEPRVYRMCGRTDSFQQTAAPRSYRFTKIHYAALFGLDSSSTARPLPRIA